MFMGQADLPDISSCVPPLLLTSEKVRRAYFDFRDDVSTPPSSPSPQGELPLNVYTGAPTDEECGLPPALDAALEEVDSASLPIVNCLRKAPPAIVLTAQTRQKTAKAIAHFLNVRRAEGKARCVLIVSKTDATAAAWVDCLNPILDDIKLTRLRPAKAKREAAYRDLQNLRAPGVFVAHEKLLRASGDGSSGIGLLRDAIRQNLHGVQWEIVISDVARVEAINENYAPLRMLVDRQTEKGIICSFAEEQKKTRPDVTKADIERYMTQHLCHLPPADRDISRVWMTSKAIRESVQRVEDGKDEMDIDSTSLKKHGLPTRRNLQKGGGITRNAPGQRLDVSDDLGKQIERKGSPLDGNTRREAVEPSGAGIAGSAKREKATKERRPKGGNETRAGPGRTEPDVLDGFWPDPEFQPEQVLRKPFRNRNESLTARVAIQDVEVEESKERIDKVLSRKYIDSGRTEAMISRSPAPGRKLKSVQNRRKSFGDAQERVSFMPHDRRQRPYEEGLTAENERAKTGRPTRDGNTRLRKPLNHTNDPSPSKVSRAYWDSDDSDNEAYKTPPSSYQNMPSTYTNWNATATKLQKKAQKLPSRKGYVKQGGSDVSTELQKEQRSRSFQEGEPSSRTPQRNVSLKNKRKVKRVASERELRVSTNSDMVTNARRQRSTSKRSSSLPKALPSKVLPRAKTMNPVRRRSREVASPARRKSYQGDQHAASDRIPSSNAQGRYTSRQNSPSTSDSWDCVIVGPVPSGRKSGIVDPEVITISSGDENNDIAAQRRPSNPRRRREPRLNRALPQEPPAGFDKRVNRAGTGRNTMTSSASGVNRRVGAEYPSKENTAFPASFFIPEGSRKIGPKHHELDSLRRRKYMDLVAHGDRARRSGLNDKALKYYLDAAAISDQDDRLDSMVLALASQTSSLQAKDFAPRSPKSPINKDKRKRHRSKRSPRRSVERGVSKEVEVVDLTGE